MLKIRRSWDRLIFNMEIPILVRRHLYIETTPDVIDINIEIHGDVIRQFDWYRIMSDNELNSVSFIVIQESNQVIMLHIKRELSNIVTWCYPCCPCKHNTCFVRLKSRAYMLFAKWTRDVFNAAPDRGTKDGIVMTLKIKSFRIWYHSGYNISKRPNTYAIGIAICKTQCQKFVHFF